MHKISKKTHSLWGRHSPNRIVIFLSDSTLVIFSQPKSVVLELLPWEDLEFAFLKCHCKLYDLSSTPYQDGFISSASVCLHSYLESHFGTKKCITLNVLCYIFIFYFISLVEKSRDHKFCSLCSDRYSQNWNRWGFKKEKTNMVG